MMETKTIKSITEAHSMQPMTIEVTLPDSHERRLQNDILNDMAKNEDVAKIVFETRKVASDKEVNVLVGYNYEGFMLFEYLQSSVNIHYFVL